MPPRIVPVFRERFPDCSEHRPPVRGVLPAGNDRFPMHCPSIPKRIPTTALALWVVDCVLVAVVVVVVVVVVVAVLVVAHRACVARPRWRFQPWIVPCCSIPVQVSRSVGRRSACCGVRVDRAVPSWHVGATRIRILLLVGRAAGRTPISW